MKMIRLKKSQDRVELRDKDGRLVADVQIAASSHASNVDLAFKADPQVKIERVRIA